MIFEKDLITQSRQRTDQQSIYFYVSLNGLQSHNEYQIKLTVGNAQFFSSEFEVPVSFWNGDEFVDKSYYPTYLEISQNVDGNFTTKTINIVETASYVYSSPYYQLLLHFYALNYTLKETDFIQQFFADCPDFTSETVSVTNPVVKCSPAQIYLYKYLHYKVTSPVFDLYQQAIDNSNQFQLLNSLNQVSGSHLTEEDYRDIMAIEAYNRNYLLAHLQPNITGNLEVTGDINATYSGSGSGGGSSTDVSGIVTQLQNISNKLTYTHNNNVTADLAELLYYVAEALEYGLTYDDSQDNKHSFLDDLNKKLEYTQTIDNESVTKNITQTLSDTKDTIANSETTVINNLDYSDRISSKPKTSGYPDDDLLI